MTKKSCLPCRAVTGSLAKQSIAAGFILAAAMGGLTGPAQAQNVTIVYPISGASYPITDPSPGPLNSAYFTASFSVTCKGGSHKVEWGFDGATVGNETFYDQTSVQLVHKLPGGKHLFWVKAGRCGGSEVRFLIGN